MGIKIKAEHEDTIWRVQNIVQELEKIQGRYFTELFEELKEDGFCDSWESEKQAEEFLFDYVFNCEDMIEFWDYCKEFNLDMDD
jgi:hypothetical protein